MGSSVSATLMLAFFFWYFVCSFARDSIRQGSWLKDDGSTLVSPNGTFELGFFTPPGSPLQKLGGRYVGIWYRELKEKAVVWVANREAIKGRDGSFGITEDGNLMARGNERLFPLYSGGNWRGTRLVKLMNSGNLVLTDTRTGDILWESFKNPTDTFLPGMKMDENLTLTSWLSPINPTAGKYNFKLEQENQKNQYNIVLVGLIDPYWSSKDSEGTFDKMTDEILSLLSNSTAAIESKRYGDHRLVMNSSGEIQYYMNRSSSPAWWAPRDRCGVSKACGKAGSCNANNEFMCKCLPGFKPDSPKSWGAGNFSSGCVRKSSLCDNKDNHTFLRLKMMKVQPRGRDSSIKSDSCRETCLNDCGCKAYAETHGTPRNGTMKCLTWTDDPNTLQEEYDHYEYFELFVRVLVSDIGTFLLGQISFKCVN